VIPSFSCSRETTRSKGSTQDKKLQLPVTVHSLRHRPHLGSEITRPAPIKTSTTQYLFHKSHILSRSYNASLPTSLTYIMPLARVY